MLDEYLERNARPKTVERFARPQGWRLALLPSRSAMLNESARSAMLDWLPAERNALRLKVGDLLDAPLGAYCSTSVWSALLDRQSYRGALCSTTAGRRPAQPPPQRALLNEFERSAVLN